MPEKRKCPVKGPAGCDTRLPYPCGHCPECGWPLDNHDGLGVNGKDVNCTKP